MTFPIITLQLESMRETINHALMQHHNEVENYVNSEIERLKGVENETKSI